MSPFFFIALGVALIIGPFIPYAIDVKSQTAQGILFMLFFTAPIGGGLILVGLGGFLSRLFGGTDDVQRPNVGARKADPIKDHLDRIAADRIAELKRTNRSSN